MRTNENMASLSLSISFGLSPRVTECVWEELALTVSCRVCQPSTHSTYYLLFPLPSLYVSHIQKYTRSLRDSLSFSHAFSWSVTSLFDSVSPPLSFCHTRFLQQSSSAFKQQTDSSHTPCLSFHHGH